MSASDAGKPLVRALHLVDHYVAHAAPAWKRWARLATLLATACVSTALWANDSSSLHFAETYSAPIAILCAAFAALIVERHLLALQNSFATSWLATLPIGVAEQRRWLAGRATRPIAWLGLLLLILLVPNITQPIAAWLPSVALAAGAGAGYVLSLRPRRSAPATTTRVPIKGGGCTALARRPLVLARAMMGGRELAPWLLAMLLSVPGGTTLDTALLLIGSYLLAFAPIVIAIAALRNLQAVASWLRATPLSLGKFALLAFFRPGIALSVALVVLFVSLTVIGMPWRENASLMLLVAALAASLACAALRFRFEPARVELHLVTELIVVVAMAAAAGIVFAIASAIAIALWNLARTLRNESLA